MWRLYEQLSGQWRVGMNGAVGLDLNVFLPRIAAKGWDADRALTLLHAIERAWLNKAAGNEDESNADG